MAGDTASSPLPPSPKSMELFHFPTPQHSYLLERSWIKALAVLILTDSRSRVHGPGISAQPPTTFLGPGSSSTEEVCPGEQGAGMALKTGQGLKCSLRPQ